MADENSLIVPKHDLYVSISTQNDEVRFGFGPSAREARDGLSKAKKERQSKKDQKPIVRDASAGGQFGELLKNINSSMSGYGELISLSGALAKVVTGPMTTSKITTFAKMHLDLIEEDNGVKTYGMRDEKTLDFMAIMERNGSLLKGFLFLPPAILMGCVSFYDSAFSDILRIFLSLNPSRFKNSDKTFTAAQIFALKDVQNVVDVIIENEIDNLMRGSHATQIEYIDKNEKTSIKSNYADWPNFVEIFERRNIVSHNNGIVNEIYISNCKAAGCDSIPKIGTKLKMSRGYIRRSTNILHEMLIRVLFELWSKVEKGHKENLYFGINETSFELLQSKNYDLSSKILTFALSKNDQSASEEARRMMAVNLAIARKFLAIGPSFEDALDAFQWKSSSDKFQICVAAIREDIDTVQLLLPRVRLSEELGARDFQTWPVFHWMRANPTFLEAVRETYGVQLSTQT